jgi:putative transposase
MQIDGTEVTHCSPDQLARMLTCSEASLLNPPLTEQNIELRLGDASEDTRFDYRYRKTVGRELDTFVRGAPKALQMSVVRDITQEFARKAAKRNLTPPNMPTYETAKAWQREAKEKGTHSSKLLVIDHRGNPRKKRINEQYEVLMESTIRELHNSKANPTATSEYGEFRLRCQELLHPELTPTQADRIIPHFTTYLSRVKEYDTYQRSKARSSTTQHRKSSTHGGKLEHPEIIGGAMQIDATKLNVFVKVDGVNTSIRPWLTILIDVYTRVITGRNLSLSPPSSSSTISAVLMSCTEDVQAKRVIPIVLQHDNGSENSNSAVRHIASELCFDLQPGAPYYPNHQAVVESNFNSMEKRCFHLMGGTTFGKLGQNRPYQAEKYPVYSLSELDELIEEYIDVYHHQPHTGLNGMSPNLKWEVATQDPLLQPETATTAFTRSLSLITIDRKITDGKVAFLNLSWKSPNLATMEKELEGTSRMVKVYIDPYDLSTVYVSDPRRKRNKKPAYATNPPYQNKLTLDMHEAICEWRDDWLDVVQDTAGAKNLLAYFHRKLRDDAADVMVEINGKGRRKADFRDKPAFKEALRNNDAPLETSPARKSSTPTTTQPFKTR